MAEPGHERSVSWLQSRTVHLTAKDRRFMAEHHNLDGRFVVFAPSKSEQLDQPDERHVDEGHRHEQSSLALCPQGQSWWTSWMGFWAPTRWNWPGRAPVFGGLGGEFRTHRRFHSGVLEAEAEKCQDPESAPEASFQWSATCDRSALRQHVGCGVVRQIGFRDW
jgi:hypothetical protein